MPAGVCLVTGLYQLVMGYEFEHHGRLLSLAAIYGVCWTLTLAGGAGLWFVGSTTVDLTELELTYLKGVCFLAVWVAAGWLTLLSAPEATFEKWGLFGYVPLTEEVVRQSLTRQVNSWFVSTSVDWLPNEDLRQRLLTQVDLRWREVRGRHQVDPWVAHLRSTVDQSFFIPRAPAYTPKVYGWLDLFKDGLKLCFAGGYARVCQQGINHVFWLPTWEVWSRLKDTPLNTFWQWVSIPVQDWLSLRVDETKFYWFHFFLIQEGSEPEFRAENSSLRWRLAYWIFWTFLG